jgi:NAD-dependent SIR2 family protein deacetylase
MTITQDKNWVLTYAQKSLIVIIKKGGVLMQAYCVKCKAKKEIKNPRAVTMKNKKPATTGICPTCGTKMYRIGKSK